MILNKKCMIVINDLFVNDSVTSDLVINDSVIIDLTVMLFANHEFCPLVALYA